MPYTGLPVVESGCPLEYRQSTTSFQCWYRILQIFPKSKHRVGFDVFLSTHVMVFNMILSTHLLWFISQNIAYRIMSLFYFFFQHICVEMQVNVNLTNWEKGTALVCYVVVGGEHVYQGMADFIP